MLANNTSMTSMSSDLNLLVNTSLDCLVESIDRGTSLNLFFHCRKKQFKLPSFEKEHLQDLVSVSLDKPSSLRGFLACFHVFIPVIV